MHRHVKLGCWNFKKLFINQRKLQNCKTGFKDKARVNLRRPETLVLQSCGVNTGRVFNKYTKYSLRVCLVNSMMNIY